MPIIKIDHIISFSSEDPVHVANNLLSGDTTKKWKCKGQGEKNAVVVLQLEKASVITAIDIGNEHSAYVEVLASRSGTSDDYKVLLVASTFMTPVEARQNQNANKVRMFTKEHLSKPECDEKWDRVKIVCTQPFNKHVQYGLSFINLHTNNEKPVAPVQTHIGKFILRPDSPDNLTAGSLFEKRKELTYEKSDEKLTGAAAIREAGSSSSLAQYGSPVCKPKLKTQNATPRSRRDSDSTMETPKPRNRNELLYSKDEEDPNEKIDKVMEKKAKEKEILEKEKEDKTPLQKKKVDRISSAKKKLNGGVSPIPLDVSVSTPSSSKTKYKDRRQNYESDRKRKNQDKQNIDHYKRAKRNPRTKPFEKLLDGVVLVISGIQNPDRATLRTSATAMGAKYKADWDNSCTHLICAFINTPKFNQVKGKGKIVTRTWLQDCYAQRKKLPWRRYALDKSDASQNESEDEICETVDPGFPEHAANDDSDVDYVDYSEHKEEASDTDERIAKILEQQQLKERENKNVSSDDSDTDIETPLKRKENGDVITIYDADTDEEDRPQVLPMSVLSTTNLRSFFANKKFYIDHSLGETTLNKLRKYIIAYRGKVFDDPTVGVDAIITRAENSSTFKEINSSSVCLNPDWVWECHNCQKLVPMDQYIY